MRLAFNATALLSPLTGIGQYSFQLAQEYLRREECAMELFYGSYWDHRLYATPSKTLAAALPWIRNVVPRSYQLRRWLQNARFYQHARKNGKGKFDVYHEPNFLPLRFDGPTVITVHDLSWIRHPETHPEVRVNAMNRYFEPGLRRADAIITDSAFVKQELMQVFGVSERLISVVPLGVESLFQPLQAEQTQTVLVQHQLVHGRYFLAVGTLEPRKNLGLALTAYMQLPERIRCIHPLVLIGMKGWRTTALEEQIAPLIRSGQVRQLGYVSRADLAILVAGAMTLVYPSIYEGFGLPPLEAMACGVPVVCANSSSLPEVVGDAGVLVDPHDDSELARTLTRLTEDEAERATLGLLARNRSLQFTWSRCADATLAVYRSVIS
jgi:glycosyltransferase involved in cell wall biosynthesis